ncbi:hypothetical protein [Desulfolutivibrio sulfoxidireducens]|uniref:hypothetical protein n=1 Tax=Desulfolutivibrio sulfoxidireducens TaxID=2773299 RepID=UPI00159E1272|nr:hypothetical protein [Desulfolutivibrio sulfoxidireducens]QLA21282.1 hypothetical protein GD604_16900 [Desulfolutivibrio sulfoxidireducens]
MNEHERVNAERNPVPPGAAAPEGQDIVAGDVADLPPGLQAPIGPRWERLVRGLEAKTARLVEDGLARLGQELEQSRRREAEAAFLASHPEFDELRQSGRLDELRRENPLLDEVGAYFAAMLERERADVAKRLEEAASQAEKRAVEGLRARRFAATLGQGPGAAPDRAGDPELAEPGRFGGVNAVLAKRLATRRVAAGN